MAGVPDMPEDEGGGRNWREALARLIKEKGLRLTRQRRIIADVFFSSGGHVNLDDLYRKVRRRDKRIGYATVYRTLRLLSEYGLASARQFGDGTTRFESAGQQHHDHLICLRCGSIVEFEHPTVERLQGEIAAKHGFKILNHKMELYGVCRECHDK